MVPPSQGMPHMQMHVYPYMVHMGGGYYLTGQGHGFYQNPLYYNQSFHGAWNQMAQPRLHFSTMLNFPDLSKLMNNLVCHNLVWPLIHAKLPFDVLKLQGKNDEDTGDHVMTCHSWFSLNSLHCDFFKLRLF